MNSIKTVIESLKEDIEQRELIKEHDEGFIDGLRYVLYILKQIQEEEE